MTRESLLKGSVWKTESDERRSTMLTEAQAERQNAFSNLIILIDDQAEDIAEQHSKPLAGVQAETAYLQQLRQGLEGSSDRITAFFAEGSASQAQPQAINEAEQRVIEVEQQLEQAEANQDRLRDEARRASTLQARLDQVEAENTRLQRELDQARRNNDKPNPLSEKVAELEEQLNAATTEKEEEKAEVARIKGELDRVTSDKEAAESSANDWRQKAIEHGYVEPGSQPDPDPNPEPDKNDEADSQDSAAPEQGRRRRWLPGHGRNLGTQNGGEQ
jgi:DNA repair exonuclease SbcCD ATPase subunit